VSRALVLDQLTKRFGPLTALAPLSLRWTEGQVVALVGANGGGKSTLLKLLSGVWQPDGGSVSGLETFTTAWMPDKLAFSRGWTATTWLELLASWKKAPPGRVGAVLAEADLTAFARQPVATFSQGMLRRLLYAQTKLVEADLVLLDEPEGGLDPHWLLQLEAELARLRQEGKTVVFSTHLVDLAVAFADELCVFSAGSVITREPSALWQSLESGQRRQRLAELIRAE